MNDKQIKFTVSKWKIRPYSWSQHSSWDWDAEDWFGRYVLGAKSDSSAAMEFGNTVGDSLGTPEQMIDMPILPHKEFEIRAKLAGVELLGFLDFYDDEIPKIQENKTSSNVAKWNQKSVDTHGQLDYYATLLYLPHVAGCKDGCALGCEKGVKKLHREIRPEDLDIELYYIPVQATQDFGMEITPGAVVQSFSTKRTTKDVFTMMKKIRSRRIEMEAYAMRRLKECS